MACENCNKVNNKIVEIGLVDEEYYFIKRLCRSCGEIAKITSPLKSDLKCYQIIRLPDGTNICLHRWVWEQYHNESLGSDRRVHHLNGKKGDNRPKNLYAILTSGHSAYLNKSHSKNKIRVLQKRISQLEEELCQARMNLPEKS